MTSQGWQVVQGRGCFSLLEWCWKTMVQHRSTIRGFEEVKKETADAEGESGVWRWKLGCWCARPSLAGPKSPYLAVTQPWCPFSSRAASPSSTFWAALLDGAVALVSERSLWAGPQRMVLGGGLMLIQWMSTVSAGACGKYAVPQKLRRAARSTSTAKPHSSPAKTMLWHGPNLLLNLLLDWEALLMRVCGPVYFEELVLLYKQHP